MENSSTATAPVSVLSVMRLASIGARWRGRFSAFLLCASITACGSGGDGELGVPGYRQATDAMDPRSERDATVLPNPDGSLDGSAADEAQGEESDGGLADRDPVEAGSEDEPADVSRDADADTPPLVSKFCGDGIRDPVLEECDRGMAALGALCSADCRIVEQLVPGETREDGGTSAARAIGEGRHPIAVSESGGVAIVTTEWSDSDVRLMLTAYPAEGSRLPERVSISDGSKPVRTSHPVVAARGGKYAVAYADLGGDGDELGVALRLVDPVSLPTGAPSHANATTDFSQYDPDIVATPSGFVVAWVDDANFATAPDIQVRTFDFDLMPTSPETALAKTVANEGNVALASFGSGWAAAWRAGGAAGETVHARSGSKEWTVGPFPPGPSGDRPALVELDESHLLLVFTAGAGVPSSFRLRAAVLDTAATGHVDVFDVDPLAPEGTGLSQDQPSAARVHGEIYLAWRTRGRIGDARHDELWMKRMLMGASLATLDGSSPEFPVPRSSEHRAGNQQRPALGSSSAELVAVFEDQGGSFGPAEKLGIVVQAIPVPIVRLP